MNSKNNTIDLNDALKRLSVFANIPNISAMSYRDQDQDQDENSELDDNSDELDNSEDVNNETEHNEMTFHSENEIQVNNTSADEENITLCNKNNIELKDCYQDEFHTSNSTVSNKNGDALKISNGLKQMETGSFDRRKSVSNSKLNSNSDYLQKPMNPATIQPLSISTTLDYEVDSQKSPGSQLFDLGRELDKVTSERDKLASDLKMLKMLIKDNYELRIRNLLEENSKIKVELSSSKKKIKDLQESSININDGRSNQIEKLRLENQSLTERLVDLQTENTKLHAQVEKLQKYENSMQNVDLIQVNKKLYQLVSRIGQGGFSEVYHCISFLKDSAKKSYALKKVNLNNLDAQNKDLVMNEIELLKKLQSSNKVIDLIDYQYLESKKLLYLVMEIGSTDLSVFFKKEVHKNKCVLEPCRTYYWQKMLEAVYAIHQLGVIHSDIKPSNFLVVGCEVKLIDFNISNTISDRTSITQTSDCGTLNYMAPEAIQMGTNKTRINQKVDIWSMGMILYFMTFGRLPFQHITNQYQLLFAICDSNTQIEIPIVQNQHLKETLYKCLRKDPNERYTAEELLRHPYILNKH